MTTKSKPRKPAAKTTAPTLSHSDAIVQAEDILAVARQLADGVGLMALQLNEYERGAICSVADVIRDKITDSLDLLDSCQQPGRASSMREAEKRLAKAGFAI